MDRIFVATDGSAGGTRAVTFASHLAGGLHAGLTILTVSNPFLDSELRKFADLEHAALGDMIDAAAMEIYREASAIAAGQGAAIRNHESLIGDPAELILESITRHRPLAIVVGKRGRGRLAGLLLGSVSQKLVSLSSVPVIVVP